ncbi:MAG TPA: DUF1844 domain-containing protein [Deltaproteobacteria bacterium]|nr:DUF1844 domain-containing protein [Candidatus Binatota bacterium]HIL12283.1 DUF1844 domain-containing protein [Deltaproteobacteria bacterium]
MSEEKDEQSFTFKDKRRFDLSGDDREEGAEQADEQPVEETGESPAAAAETSATSEAGGERADLAFSTFIVGLASQAFMFLGAIADPADQQIKKDLEQAAAMIALVEVLREKTRGNLTEDEDSMFEDVLYQLHMRYVAEVGAADESSAKGSDS